MGLKYYTLSKAAEIVGVPENTFKSWVYSRTPALIVPAANVVGVVAFRSTDLAALKQRLRDEPQLQKAGRPAKKRRQNKTT